MPRRELDADARFTLTLPGAAQRTEIVAGAHALQRLPGLLADHAPAHRYVVIADANVAALYGEALVAGVEAGGPRAGLLTFQGGEASKTPATWVELLEEMVARGLGRDCCVIGLGGGVTTDLAGFVAATFMRGVPVVHVPTSLLAMIDAAIGGKTGVDLRGGKNLAGAFHQPLLVVADPETLRTLPEGELRCGLAEAFKHGAISDARYFDRLEAILDDVFALDSSALADLVQGSLRIKARLVREDVREAGARALLNFGHTIAHAIERMTDYRIPHGEAVAMGMVVEARLGEAVGVTSAGTADRLSRALGRAGLPVHAPAGLDPAELVRAAGSDKKARHGVTRYTLLRRIGEAAPSDAGWTHALPDAAVSDAVAASQEIPTSSG